MLRIVTEKQKHIIEYMGAKFTVEPNTKEESKSIMERHTFTHKIKTGAGQKDKYEERIDWVGVQADNMDTQVKAWEGIEKEDKVTKAVVKAECNSENKIAIASCKENEHICIYIQEEISKIGQAKEEDDKKKSTT